MFGAIKGSTEIKSSELSKVEYEELKTVKNNVKSEYNEAVSVELKLSS